MKVEAIVVVCGFLLVVFSAARAEAQEPRAALTERGYAYTFEDDPLDAAPLGAKGDRISVRRGAKRTLLLRPRTHFIRELFHSAEDL
jgi:hypothetical protein